MSTPAIIAGDFATFKHVQGRKVLQLVIEVPAEAASQVFSTFGYPGSGNPIPVAIARLADDARPKPEQAKERRPFSELPYAQQAGVMCNEPEFWSFLKDQLPGQWNAARACTLTDALAAAEVVRVDCKVTSRADLLRGTPAGKQWEAIKGQFFAWSRGMR